MEAQIGPKLDADELRTNYGAAIAAYQEVAQRIGAEKVDVHAADFGAGFATEGSRIADALDRLHGTTLSYLSARTSNWGSILALVDDVEEQDASNSESLGGVNGL